MRRQASKVDEQAFVIMNQAKEIGNQATWIKDLQEKQEKTQKVLDENVKRDMSVLFEQGKDIKDENSTQFTNDHLVTLIKMLKTYGQDNTVRGPSDKDHWNMQLIDRQQEENRRLREERDQLTKQLLEANAKNVQMTNEHKVTTEKHKEETKALNDQIGDFLSNNSWLKDLVFWICLGVGIYFFITLGGFAWLRRKGQNAIRESEKHRRKLNATNKMLTTFVEINDDGNETMEKLQKAAGIDPTKKVKSKLVVDDDDDD